MFLLGCFYKVNDFAYETYKFHTLFEIIFVELTSCIPREMPFLKEMGENEYNGYILRFINRLSISVHFFITEVSTFPENLNTRLHLLQ